MTNVHILVAIAAAIILMFIAGIYAYRSIMTSMGYTSMKTLKHIKEMNEAVISVKNNNDETSKALFVLKRSVNKLKDYTEMINDTMTELSAKVDDMEAKSGSDIEYYADSVLVKLTSITPFNDLKLYLTKKRDMMVVEVKRMLSMGIGNIKSETTGLSWTNVEKQLREYGSSISDEFNEYMTFVSPKDEEMAKFQNNLMHALEYGNGSKDKIFADQIKTFLKNQLEYTFKDYQNFRATEMISDKQSKNTKEFLHSLVRENNLEMAFYKLQKIVDEKKSNELTNRLTLLMSQHNSYLKDKQLGIDQDDIKSTYKQLCQSVVLFVDSVT